MPTAFMSIFMIWSGILSKTIPEPILPPGRISGSKAAPTGFPSKSNYGIHPELKDNYSRLNYY